MTTDWKRLRERLDRFADPALALAVLVLSMQPLWEGYDCDCNEVSPWGYVLVTAQCLPIAVRRSWPFPSLLVTGLATTVYGISPLPDPPVYYAGLVLVYTVAAHSSRTAAHISAVIGITCITFALAWDYPAWDYQDLTVLVATFVTAYVLGDNARNRRERAAALEVRANQLERTRLAEAAAAVVAERNRIARELHDSVAHHVSVMVIQAEAGPLAVEHRPRHAIETFASISETGKRALTEMRQLLGVLKQDEQAPREPQPGLAQVDDLVSKTRAAHLDVSIEWLGTPHDLPTAVDLSAYRVVQESLTNCLRHAPGSHVEVCVEYGDSLLIQVTDDGSRQPMTPSSAGGELHTGNGLMAMRERMALVNGSLTVGPHSSGWRVAARIPIEAEVST